MVDQVLVTDSSGLFIGWRVGSLNSRVQASGFRLVTCMNVWFRSTVLGFRV